MCTTVFAHFSSFLFQRTDCDKAAKFSKHRNKKNRKRNKMRKGCSMRKRLSVTEEILMLRPSPGQHFKAKVAFEDMVRGKKVHLLPSPINDACN